MGFPVHWCERALAETGDDIEAALNWILSNGELLSVEDSLRESIQVRSVKLRVTCETSSLTLLYIFRHYIRIVFNNKVLCYPGDMLPRVDVKHREKLALVTIHYDCLRQPQLLYKKGGRSLGTTSGVDAPD